MLNYLFNFYVLYSILKNTYAYNHKQIFEVPLFKGLINRLRNSIFWCVKVENNPY